MLSNSLTRDMGLKVGPVMLGTFAKHYFDRLKSRNQADPDQLLKQDEILYDTAFHIIKSFLHESTFHTVEELQQFSNTQTLSSPYIHLVRVLIPLCICDEAAKVLVQVLGGEDKAREIVGGVKWWQVRGIEGIDAQWITAKKDWREAKRRHKMRTTPSDSVSRGVHPSSEAQGDPSKGDINDAYEKNMDEMRCILYLHGGGYYFGSVDQERYSIQRHARKINGRVFAINYRLAPQYPFPCGIHDALSAYLYLIRPPPEADHLPIDPAHIVIAGDSAGGGMSLALLQLIRDAGLPLPAGGVLISPWCDLTHSFPSIHVNTATDILPSTGLSFHKPSMLWPPPPHELSVRVHASLRQKLRHALRMDESPLPQKAAEPPTRTSLGSNMPVNVGENTPVPPISALDPQRIILVTGAKEQLEINQQIHFYAQNSLLVHPFVSPALGYLGGLPPLFFVASDKEVLRDEIIYTAHKAASPARFPLKDESRGLYPLLDGIEERHPKPTSVHLQVYDGTCHVLPVLFLFSTPAKFCFRAMANFIRLVTGMPLWPSISASESSLLKMGRQASSPEIKRTVSPDQIQGIKISSSEGGQLASANTLTPTHISGSTTWTGPSISRKQSLRRTLSTQFLRVGSVFRRPSHGLILENEINPSDSSSGNTLRRKSVRLTMSHRRYAGESSVYEDITDNTTFEMIRERVSTQGLIRPLEAESNLGAFKIDPNMIGNMSELIIRRCISSEAHFRQKFASTYESIDKSRKKNLEREAKEEGKRFDAMRASASNSSNLSSSSGNHAKFRRSVLDSPGWGYAWALDENERPPPSSIAARRDTVEARQLALIADRAVVADTSEMNANSLWSVVMNFLAPLDRMNGSGRKKLSKRKEEGEERATVSEDHERTPTHEQFHDVQQRDKGQSLTAQRRFSQLFAGHKSNEKSIS